MTPFWFRHQLGIVVFLGILLVIALSNVLALRRLGRYPLPPQFPRVSILLPARNEEAVIGECVRSLLAPDYPDFEVLVLDDGSTDGTGTGLAGLAREDGWLGVLSGRPLPEGWIGKHWACQQLADAATGELLLFTDADTVHHPQALRLGVSALLAERADLMSGFLRQRLLTGGERLTVPTIFWCFFSFLPLALAHRVRAPGLSLTNGQWMLFRRSAYEAVGGHAAVRESPVDDIALGRRVKAKGLRWRVVDAGEYVSCRMYPGFRAAVEDVPQAPMRYPLLSAVILFILLVACTLPAFTAPAPVAVSPTVPLPAPPPGSTPPVGPALSLRRVTFSPSSEDIPNPERGFYEWLDETSPDRYAEQGYTLAYTREDLRGYISSDLPLEYLQSLSHRFQWARRAGIKLIIRFTYNEGETYPDPAPDASLEQVLRHIEQLAPVLEANRDVIAWFEAGFIGAWGEWHTSASGLDSPENKAIIRNALYAHFPRDRFILFRYPGDFTHWYPRPLTEAQAFDGSDPARTGHHNDCFLASDDDFGTYYDYDGSLKIEEWKTYIAQMTRFTPMSGETCNPNPPRSDCPTALAEMERLHWTALNEAYHPQVIQGWKDQGCYAEIRRRLGYRLSLLEASFPATIHPGGTLSLQIRLRNSGFASPLLPRPVYLVLAAQDFILPLPLEADPRRWEPGEHTLAADLSLPADLPPGEYTLALWLPDPAESLRNDPRYAVRLANEGIWDAEHGRNVLGRLTVTEDDPNPPVYLPLVMKGFCPP